MIIIIFIFFVILAGLFAGSETGIYQISRLRLRLGVEQKKLSFILLARTLNDSACLLIALLLGTNLCHYLATSAVTYLVLLNKQNQGNVEFISTIITTPILFVFAELIPKNLFYYRADAIMPRISFLVFLFDKLTKISGIVYIMKFLNMLTSGFKRSTAIKKSSALTTAKFDMIVHETNEEGILSTTQSEMMRRLGHISSLKIGSCMTVISGAVLLDVSSTKKDLIDICKKHRFSRYPVFEQNHNNIIGHVNIYQCLCSDKDFDGLHDFLKPINKMPADKVVIDGIEIMQAQADEIVLITQSVHNDKPVGIVTMKDLVEELLGELAEW